MAVCLCLYCCNCNCPEPQFEYAEYELKVYLPDKLNLNQDSCYYYSSKYGRGCHCDYHSDNGEIIAINHGYSDHKPFHNKKVLVGRVYGDEQNCILSRNYSILRKEINFEPVHEYIRDDMCFSRIENGEQTVTLRMYRIYQTSDTSDLYVTYETAFDREELDLVETYNRMALVLSLIHI